MRFFDPQCELGSRHPVQDRLQDKLGGLPFGIDPSAWPTCGDCGKPLSLIAQFVHDDVRLDLGGADRTLTVWQCEHDPGMCSTWDFAESASQAFVSAAVDGVGVVPAPGPETTVHPEARVVAWFPKDDGINEATYPAYFDEQRWMQLSEDQWAAGGQDTRIGGVPAWIQGTSEAPPAPWTFAIQLADGATMAGVPPTVEEIGLGIQRQTADGWVHERPAGLGPDQVPGWVVIDDAGWYLDGPNFGGGGTGYVFLDRTVDPPAAGFFWQC